MNKHNLNIKQEDLSEYADKENKRFRLQTQKDVDQLFGKIRRVKGRDEIRKEAIKIVVQKRLDLSDSLLSPWEDPIEETEESSADELVTISGYETEDELVTIS